MTDQVRILERKIRRDFELVEPADWGGGWPGEVEAALIDAVFSIRANYGSESTGVRKVVQSWRVERGVSPMNDLRALSEPPGLPLDEVTGNRQKVSGRLKSKVVADAAAALVSAGFSHSENLKVDQRAAEHAYTSVHGLGKVTWSYFLMLLGIPGIKADVHIRRYVANALGLDDIAAEKARALLSQVESQFSDLTHLDHAIWNLQRYRT